MIVDYSWNTAPTVNDTGYFTLRMSRLHKIYCATLSFDGSTNLTGDMSGSMDYTYSWQGNQFDNSVNVYVVLTTLGSRRAAVTADLLGRKFCCIAVGDK